MPPSRPPFLYYLQIIILIFLLSLTCIYRSRLLQSEAQNQTNQVQLGKLSEKLRKLQSGQDQVQKQYKEGYQIVLGTLRAEIKFLKEKIIKTQKMYELNNRYFKQQEQTKSLSLRDRIKRMQNILQEEHVYLQFLQDMVREKVKEDKFAKMDALANSSYFVSQSMRSNWYLLKANLNSSYTTATQLNTFEELYRRQAVRIKDQYKTQEYPEQLPFCIAVPSYNNAKDFRYEFNLQSIINQNYSNYHVVIIDDASPDMTGKHIERFLASPKVSQETKKKVLVKRNQKQMTAVPNLHWALTNVCKDDEIAFFVDGDDELVGNQAFKIFNAVYQSKKPAIAYSKAFQYEVMDELVKDNWSFEYSLSQKQNNLYRDVPQRISHLRSFRVGLYRLVNQSSLKDENGEWFRSTYDEVLCLPMLEMSCGNIQLINEYSYLYVYGTGFNDRMVDQGLQWSIARRVKKHMQRYQCVEKFMKQEDKTKKLKQIEEDKWGDDFVLHRKAKEETLASQTEINHKKEQNIPEETKKVNLESKQSALPTQQRKGAQVQVNEEEEESKQKQNQQEQGSETESQSEVTQTDEQTVSKDQKEQLQQARTIKQDKSRKNEETAHVENEEEKIAKLHKNPANSQSQFTRSAPRAKSVPTEPQPVQSQKKLL